MRRLVGAAVAAMALTWAGSASAATIIDFESYATGTVISGPLVGPAEPAIRAWGTVVEGVAGASGKVLQTTNTAPLAPRSLSFGGVRVDPQGDGYPGDLDYGVTIHSVDIFMPDGGYLHTRSDQRHMIPAGQWYTWTSDRWFDGGSPVFLRGVAYVDNITFTGQYVAIPEPGTWAMMILGFGMAGSAMRRRKFRPA